MSSRHSSSSSAQSSLASQPAQRPSWSEAIAVYRQPRVITMLFLGFAAGLPLLLVFSTLSAWLRDMEVSRSAIGFFGWVGITYSIKVFWAPIVDRVPLPWLTAALGKRRSWILLGQFGIMLGLLGMALVDAQNNLMAVALMALVVAFSSSTQDIAIDALRIEAAEPEYQGAMSATYILGYRVAMLVAGAGALYIAQYAEPMVGKAEAWQWSYAAMASLMLVGVVTVLVIGEPSEPNVEHLGDELVEELLHRKARSKPERAAVWFASAVVAPFVDFFKRNGRFALVILLFIGMFRLSDIVMGIMANPFYLDLGFSKAEIASIGKLFGFFMTIAGSFLGGLMVVRYGINRPLLAGATMVALTNLLFAHLATVGPDINWLAVVISADNLSGGFSNAVLIAYLSSLTNRAYTATQYALFSSLMTLPGKFTSGFSGLIVDGAGYHFFFTYAAVMGIPAILLAFYLLRREGRG